MDKPYYICHYCCEYKTQNKVDMNRHFKRKNKCVCFSLYSYEAAEKISLTKKFYLNVDISSLFKTDMIYIVNNYNLPINYIENDFRKKSINESNNILDIALISQKRNHSKNEVENKSLYKNSNNKNLICTDVDVDNLDYVDDIDLFEDKNLFDQLYYNHEKKKYICDKCYSGYVSKQNLIKHLKSHDECKKKQQINEIMKESLKISEIKRKKEEEENKKFEPHVINNNNNVQNNFQNIQNINNNNNNTHHNTYNLAIKDFVHDNYDITHIKDTFYQQKDFFIYHNFLRMIMENKKNQNIFFANNEAIIYSDNELNKMSSDKAGYLILDKLSTSFNQLINKQDEEVREYYAFITKYYSVLKGQYKHDTIFKDYDVDDRRFFYTANSGMFRSRDKYLSKMVSVINRNSNDIRQNMNIKGDDIKDIPLINPSIEDFASARMRYRDLKDK